MMPNFLALAFNLPTLLIILALALLIFGNRLPSIGKNLGKSIVGFKKGLKEGESNEEDEEDTDDDIEEPVVKKKTKELPSKTSESVQREREKVAQAEED